MLSNSYIGILLKEVYRALYLNRGYLDWWPGDSSFEVCIGAILTQNTAWTNVEKAIKNLKANSVLDCDSILNIHVYELAKLIKPSGYFNQKAVYLKEFCTFLKEYPIELLKSMNLNEARSKILNVKGIGKETADSILLYALYKPIFVVDAYTKRVFYRIGIVKQEISYDEMQKIFMENLETDTELFNDYHAQIVMLGKDYCRKKPSCKNCCLRTEGICSYNE